jgi:alpha-beta hydrolase superfamily lysophospholipase
MKPNPKTFFKRAMWFILSLFLIMNIVAGFHAYKFTHFDSSGKAKTKDATQLSFGDKLKTLFFGVSNPRPVNLSQPDIPFETITLKSNKSIACWYIKHPQAKGTVILFHGYSSEKSASLGEAMVFNSLGYNTLLVDFMGSGGSEGNQTTIGFYEAKEVKTAIDHISHTGEKNIILYGSSMGAVAIMKCMKDDSPEINAIIMECPFGTMLKTVQGRFKNMHVPAFPMANLLVFWGGVENKFNAFAHNPQEYAKSIKCPVLLMYGQKDDKVSRQEIDAIYNNLGGTRQLSLFPLAGHQEYLKMYPDQWAQDAGVFLAGLPNSRQIQ